tara:strand:+ start:91 stop:411 length:321 start_codon:yes stop_codon:yes gene_type:complete
MAYQYQMVNGQLVELTADEITALENKDVIWNNESINRKLSEVRIIRNEKLQETDWLAISEKITDAEKTWRQSLRDIPVNHTDENAYDLLLARNDDGELTHSIWSKP